MARQTDGDRRGPRVASAAVTRFAERAGQRRPASMALPAGALGVSLSAVFIKLSGASPGTATFWRCLLALPLTPMGAVVLGALVLGERPTDAQLAGCALVLAAGYVAATRPESTR